MLVLLILPIFTWMHARWRSGDRSIHQLMVFELALACFFVSGIVARIAGRFDWVELFPMRVYAVFALLLFFWQVLSILVSWMHNHPWPGRLCLFAALLLLLMPSPLLGLRDLLGSHLTRFTHPNRQFQNADRGSDGDYVMAVRWLSQNSALSDLVIAPPWWNDSFYYLNRPLIANWHAPAYDRITHWRERLEALVGDTSNLDPDLASYGEMDPRAWAHYASLSTPQIEAIRDKYAEDGRARWLVTTARYDYPLAYRAGTYLVYKLP